MKENTGCLIAYPLSFGLKSKSFNIFFPNITLVAKLTYGSPYAFDIKGTVLEALGLASIIYTFSSLIANCMLIKPTVFRAKAIFLV